MPNSLSQKVAKVLSKPKVPLWAGPEDEGPMGGITQSMFSRFVVCPERFRVQFVEGWTTPERFNHRLGYGEMWHVCEEALAAGRPWEPDLLEHCKKVVKQYKMQQEEIDGWYRTCRTQFPIYVEYWKKQPDVVKREPLLQEEAFHVPYKLPSGRTVFLRGKFDAVDSIQKGVWLQENKTKRDVNEAQMRSQLTFDLQVMTYLVALVHMPRGGLVSPGPVKGVRYNVIRRPFSGGRGSIRRSEGTQGAKCPKCNTLGKVGTEVCPKCNGRGRIGGKPAESKDDFYGRLKAIIEGEPEYWFMRWKADLKPCHITEFERQFLAPVMENLSNDYDWWKYCYINGKDPFDIEAKFLFDREHGYTYCHWRLPFGVYNPISDGGMTELDEYLATGITSGLVQATTLFDELK